MGSTAVFWLFLAFVVGAGMLALMLGYRSIEERRAREEEQRRADELRAAENVAAMPRFFVRPVVSESSTIVPVFDEALLADFESYVRAEQALAAQFVNEPSLDSLYRQPRPSFFVQ